MTRPHCANSAMAEEAAAGQGSLHPRRRASERARSIISRAWCCTPMPWRETSLIVEVFTRDFGRMALVARGAKRPTSQFRGCCRPLHRSRSSGAGATRSRTSCGSSGSVAWPPLRGHALLSAFYANELLVRLLARADPHERLFDRYLEHAARTGRSARHDVDAAHVRARAAARGRLCGAARSAAASGEPIDPRRHATVFSAEAGAHRLGPDERDDSGACRSPERPCWRWRAATSPTRALPPKRRSCCAS